MLKLNCVWIQLSNKKLNPAVAYSFLSKKQYQPLKCFFYWSLEFFLFILAETISECTVAKAYHNCKCGEFLICHRDQYCHGIISGRPEACEYYPEEGKL